MIFYKILHLDVNILMSLELLPSLITCIFNIEVNLMSSKVSSLSCLNLMLSLSCLSLVYLMYLVSCLLLRCVCCVMYAAMYAVNTVNKCEYVRSGF